MGSIRLIQGSYNNSQMFMHLLYKSIRCLALLATLGGLCHAQQVFNDETLELQEFLVLPRVGRYGRVPIHIDPVQARIVKEGSFSPREGEDITSHDGPNVRWETQRVSEDGKLDTVRLRGGYAMAEVSSPRRQVVLLEATGHAMVFVNGEPRAGDPYLTSRTILPIELKKGSNYLLFHLAAAYFQAKLKKPREDVFFDLRDVTIPTLVRGSVEPVWVSVLLVNCRNKSLNDAQVTATLGESKLTSKVEPVPALSVRKIAIPAVATWDDSVAEKVPLTLSLASSNRTSNSSFDLSVVEKSQPQCHTFRSSLDGSVQSYWMIPAAESSANPGALVTLHDNGESAAKHIRQFSSLKDANIIAPEGRRAEGCDWEDWSMSDATEALDDAAKHVSFDASRVWLRGTGAGGHGALRLGGSYPSRWAALVPRSPWVDYPLETIQTVDLSPTEEMLDRVADENQLLPLVRNLTGIGVMLEDVADPEGLVDSDSHELKTLFHAFHEDFQFRGTEGNEVDTAAVMEFCSKRSIPSNAELDEADCVTYNPRRNSSCRWLTILQQINQGELSRAAVKYHPERNLFVGLTANVKALSIDVTRIKGDTIVEVVLDDEVIGEFAVEGKPLMFLRSEESWLPIPMIPSPLKQPLRNGGLRSAFENNAVLVYGTRGSKAENDWARAKARYDAETLLVRSNGSVDVVSDTDFNPSADRNRNVVLYGNADTNSAWPQLLSTSPVQVRGDGVWVDRRPELGNDLACVFVYPRRRSSAAVVGVISGTGLEGMKATDRLPLFVNGTSFPDLLLYGAQSLLKGTNEVRAAGYFSMGWNVERGEIKWRDGVL